MKTFDEEFKGTKGDWQVVDDYENYVPYSQDTPQLYIWDGDEQAAAPICDMGQIGDLDYAEALANAKLISKAPELGRCLMAFVDMCYAGATKPQIEKLRMNAEKVLKEALLVNTPTT